jgi:hypothetical protein
MILSVAACSGADDTTDRAAYDATRAGEEARAEAGDMASIDPVTGQKMGDDMIVVTTSADMNARATFMLSSDEVKASKLIGAEVRDATGAGFAKVADVWLGENGASPMLILRHDGALPIGAKLHSVSFSEVTVTPSVSPDDVPGLAYQVAGGTLATLPEFNQTDGNEDRLASEMIGKRADFALGEDSARIDDLILSTRGEARYAVISPGRLDSTQVVIDADTITRAEGDSEGELVITVSEDVFAQAKAYRNR